MLISKQDQGEIEVWVELRNIKRDQETQLSNIEDRMYNTDYFQISKK